MRVRRAKKGKKSPAEVQLDLMKRFDLSRSWFDGVDDEELTRADEAWAAKQDLTPEEVAGLTPTARVIVLDECFNGRFIDRPCIATSYLYGQGETVAVVANTVNVLQAMRREPMARPSRPSVRLTALAAPARTRTTNNG